MNRNRVPGRIVGPPCKCGCFAKVGKDNIDEIFKQFSEIGIYDQQNSYISKLVSSVDIKSSRIQDSPRRKLRNIKYTVIAKSQAIPVLQQTLPTPRLPTTLQYYRRKLWTYNFCIHDIKTGDAVMYVWNETVGKRASVEISSCLQYNFEHFVKSDVKTMIMFSDNCGDQNKDINVSLSCLLNIHENRFHNIEHYFMFPGLSFSPCDRNFGKIEQKVNGVEVFSQLNYSDIIKTCLKKIPFIVINMSRNLFLDVAILQNHITNRSGGKFKNGRVFIYKNTYKQGFMIKSTLNQDQPLRVRLQKGRKLLYDNNLFNLSAQQLPIKYPTPIKLHLKKLADLKVLLDFIPPNHKAFIEDIISEQQSLGDVLLSNTNNDPYEHFVDYNT